MRQGPAAGLTLLELLVAMTIFALIATAGYSALRQGIQTQERLQTQQRFWRGLESAFILIGRDLEQARMRAPRVRGGQAALAFRGPGSLQATREGDLFRLTRGGHTSFRKGPVSPYLRVAYRLRDGALVRATWPRLDTPAATEAREAVLLEDVTEAEVRYLLPSGQRWVDRWPPAPGAAGVPDDEDSAGDRLPGAVELTLDFEEHGRFKRLFHVGPPE